MASISTLFRLVRNFKSLEVEAQYHLAQCLLLLDPELLCFGDEIVECLERVCSATSTELLDAGAWDTLQRESTVRATGSMSVDCNTVWRC